MNATIYVGDCLNVLQMLPKESVRCCVTSPPYFGLRDYGHAGQIGLEPTPEAYVAQLVEVFRQVRRVLTDDGTLWLNLGDSYAAQRGGTGMPADRLKHKDLIGIPWRVAFALQADGWYLRQDIIWHKPNPMPESVRDRCTKAHEYIFLLSKSERYFFDSEEMREPCSEDMQRRAAKGQTRGARGKLDASRQDANTLRGDHAKTIETINGRNRRSVWTVPTRAFKGAHFATYPPALIEPCILAGSALGDTILDPFNGAGTSGLVALRNGRNYIGIELNLEYANITQTRLRDDAPMLNSVKIVHDAAKEPADGKPEAP